MYFLFNEDIFMFPQTIPAPPLHGAAPDAAAGPLAPPTVKRPRRPRPDAAAVVAAIRRGQTLRQTAQQFGVSASLIHVICQQEGIKLKASITLAVRQAIVEEARKGATIMSLMRKYKISYHRVRTIIDRSGSQPMKDSSRRVLKAVALLLNTGMTFDQIGRELQTSGQRIHQIFNDAAEAGIRFPNREK